MLRSSLTVGCVPSEMCAEGLHVVSTKFLFLRELQLQDCGLDGFPDIDGLSELTVLDVSFNSLERQHYPSKELRKLLTLSMDDCGIEAP